jgi:hypothetical protein
MDGVGWVWMMTSQLGKRSQLALVSITEIQPFQLPQRAVTSAKVSKTYLLVH